MRTRFLVTASVAWFAGLVLAGCHIPRQGSWATEIRSRARHERQVPTMEGQPHRPTPLSPPDVPAHPYMAPHGGSCMHVDPATTNAYAWPGPLGHAPQVDSRSMGLLGGECPTMNIDRQGRVVAICVRDRRPSLVLLDPDTLQVIDRYQLPKRRTPLLRLRKIMQDTSGGAYFYLDHLDRAVVGTSEGTLEIVATAETPDGPRFTQVERVDLEEALTHADGTLDRLTAVLPDYDGNYWFSARDGIIGVVDRGGEVRTLTLGGEELQNSFSMAPEGPYFVTDHALYHVALGASGKPDVVWREPYDRGSRRKVGQINQGSGTTPTLLGAGYVAIADNAEPRMNVLVYRRGKSPAQRLVCRLSVFEPHQSATENTLIGHGRSLIVENNAGYDVFRTMRRGRTSAPGIARIDVRKDDSGCDLVWESKEISQTAVPKLSTSTGLVYLYTKLPDHPNNVDAYYFTAIDFETGETAFRVLAGTGARYDNNWASISLTPDGTAFVGVLNGLVRIRDGQSTQAAGAVRSPKM